MSAIPSRSREIGSLRLDPTHALPARTSAGAVPSPSLWRGIARLADPKISLASMASISLGAAAAARDGWLHWEWLAITVLGIFAIEVAKNASGEIVDFGTGVDQSVAPEDRSPFSGGKRVLVDGLLTHGQTVAVAVVAYAIGIGVGLAISAERHPGVLILEGSGSAVPPIRWDAGILVVPASAPPEYLGGYLGPYRLLRSDLAVVTMAVGPTGSESLPALRSHILRYLDAARLLITDFIPVPLADVQGARAFFATTAPGGVAARQVEHLEASHGCTVVGWSARLADRAGLAEDLDAAQGYDVLLTELKAAAVDIGVERALAAGAEVVFVDNRAIVVEGSNDLDTALGDIVDLARTRRSER